MQKLVIIGNLGSDAQVRTVSNGGEPFVSFSVGCNESYTDKEGNKQEKTTWYGCTYKHTRVAEFLKKGNQVYIEGMPNFKTYIAQDGKTYIDINVNVRVLEFLSSKKD